MRITRTLLFLLLVAVAAGAAAPFPTLNYKHRVLPNGLEIYSVQDRATPTVAIHVWYRVGSKNDPEGRSGFAHLFEHMMFKSTKNMPSEFMDRLTEDVGGFNNATTYDDYTAYYEVVPSNYLETLLWAEADRMGNLNVDEPTFKSERDVVKEEFRYRILSPPYGRLFLAIEKNSFAVHPYRRPGIGSIEELDAATLEDVRAFHSTFYRPDNAFVMVVGDFDQAQFDGWIDKYFTPIAKPDTAIPRVTAKEPARSSDKRVEEHAPNVPLPGLALTWLGPAQSSPDSYPLFLASTILGEGESSRLNLQLVNKSAIASEVNVDADLREDLGLVGMLIIMASGHTPEEGEKATLAELAKLAANPVPAAELEKAKNLVITSALRERETNNGKAFALGEAIVLQKNADEVNRGLQKLQAVTPADVQRVAKSYIADAKRVTILYREGGK